MERINISVMKENRHPRENWHHDYQLVLNALNFAYHEISLYKMDTWFQKSI